MGREAQGQATGRQPQNKREPTQLPSACQQPLSYSEENTRKKCFVSSLILLVERKEKMSKIRPTSIRGYPVSISKPWSGHWRVLGLSSRLRPIPCCSKRHCEFRRFNSASTRRKRVAQGASWHTRSLSPGSSPSLHASSHNRLSIPVTTSQIFHSCQLCLVLQRFFLPFFFSHFCRQEQAK
jgi:hypothetical protein